MDYYFLLHILIFYRQPKKKKKHISFSEWSYGCFFFFFGYRNLLVKYLHVIVTLRRRAMNCDFFFFSTTIERCHNIIYIFLISDENRNIIFRGNTSPGRGEIKRRVGVSRLGRCFTREELQTGEQVDFLTVFRTPSHFT